MRRILQKTAVVLASFLLVWMLVPTDDADAIPSFARKNNLACSSCHTAWPLLNETGRSFKENGYRFALGEEPENVISDFLNLDADFPISTVIKSRPFDKKEGKSEKIRAIHEFEIMVAGTVFKNISAFLELEGEDEENFSPSIGGWITWNLDEAFNVQLAYDSMFNADPYDTLANARKLTRGRNAIIDQRFGGADNGGRLRDARQSIVIYGRPTSKVFYLAGFSGNPGDAEGVNASNLHARVAFDVLPQLMIGGFGVFGQCESSAENCDVTRDFTRLGVDMQAEVENAVFHAAYMHTKDDLNALDPAGLLGETKNNAFYVEGIYTFMKDGRPLVVPSIRLNRFEKGDGTMDFTDLTMNLAYYLTENVRVYGEWFKQLDVPVGQLKGGRFTVQIELGF